MGKGRQKCFTLNISAVPFRNASYSQHLHPAVKIRQYTLYVKPSFAIRFRYLLMNAVALHPISGSF